MLLALEAVRSLHLERFDVKMAFLHMDETIYMRQPLGYEKHEVKKELVCLLQVLVWAQGSSNHQGCGTFGSMSSSHNVVFVAAHMIDSCVDYKITHNNSYVYLLLYVNDMLLAGSNYG